MASAPKRSKTENDDDKTIDPRIPTPPDFNPVYPYPDTSTIIGPITPIPTPPFVSDLDFATDNGGVLTIKTQPPIVNNGAGITLDYDFTDFKVTNNVLQLANKSSTLIFEGGLEKINDRVSLKSPEAPLTLNVVGGNLQLKMASNLETDVSSALSLKTPQAPITFNPQGALMLNIGSGLTIQASKLIVSVGDGLQNTANQISLKTPLEPLAIDAGQHNLKLNIGDGLETNTNNQLAIKTPDAPLLLDPTNHNLKLNVSTGLQTVNNALAVKSPQPPLALDTTQNNLKLNYSTSDFTITNNELAIINKAPNLTFSGGLVQNGNNVTINDPAAPLTIDTTTNKLQLTLGSGLSTTSANSLQVNIKQPLVFNQNVIALSLGGGLTTSSNKLTMNLKTPMFLDNNQVALKFGGGLKMDTADTLVINTQNPLGVLNNELIFNYNSKDFSITNSYLQLNLQAGNGISIDRSGAQTMISINSAVPFEQVIWGTPSNQSLNQNSSNTTYNLNVIFYRTGPMVFMRMTASCNSGTNNVIQIHFQNTDFQISQAYQVSGTLKLLNNNGTTLPDDPQKSKMMIPRMSIVNDLNQNEVYIAGVKPNAIKRKWEYNSDTQKFIMTLTFPQMDRPFHISFTDSWYGQDI